MTNPLKKSRLEARISAEVLALVRQAAELQGRSVSDFVVAAAQEVASKTIEEAHVVFKEHPHGRGTRTPS